MTSLTQKITTWMKAAITMSPKKTPKVQETETQETETQVSPTSPEQMANLKSLASALDQTEYMSDVEKEIQESLNLDLDPRTAESLQKLQSLADSTPLPLPSLSLHTPPALAPKPSPVEKVDHRTTRKLTTQQKEKMRLGKLKAKASKEEGRENLEQVSTSPSPPPLKLPGTILEELPESMTGVEGPPPPLTLLEPEVPEQPSTGPIDKQLEAFKEYLNTEYGPHGVEMQLRAAFSGQFAPLPPPHRWQISNHLDISRLVWEQLQADAFIDDIWPSIKLLLGNDILNREWAARVATILSLFNLIKILPVVVEGLRDAEAEQERWRRLQQQQQQQQQQEEEEGEQNGNSKFRTPAAHKRQLADSG